jgi:hypothetical protein
MDELELTEVPLSNREVLKVLKARPNPNEHPRTSEMIKYLESIEKGPYTYPLEILRNLKISKNLEADLNTLTIVSNVSDLSILSPSDRKRIEQHFAKLNKNKV